MRTGPSLRVDLERSFVLHQRPYRESSQLLEIFSRNHGRLGVVGRGGRAPRSRLRGILQPFCPLLLSWSGSGDLATLVAAEQEDSFTPLGSRAIASGFYLNELILRLFHRHDAAPALFDVYELTLRKLGDERQLEPALRIFEKSLLEAIGYGLLLDHEADTGVKIIEGKVYYYHPEKGPVKKQERTGSGIEISGDTLLALAREDLREHDCLLESKRLMRRVLRIYLGAKPLESRTLFTGNGMQSAKTELGGG